jgi:predicted phage terminase large subunit-like protein
MRTLTIEPQAGPQTQFLSHEADIVIYGGAAGGGKTYGLLLDPLRHHNVQGADAVIFRRVMPEITNPGGLWDVGQRVYLPMGATPANKVLRFKKGLSLKFAHLEHEHTVLSWHGGQIPWIGFDELCSFTEYQFFYMLGRNRSIVGIPGRIRATCNPDPDSWVKKFIRWWLDDAGEYADPRKAGFTRWFNRPDEHSTELIWSDDRRDENSKSVTFIPSKLEDNKILMEKDPGYRANLMALPYVDRMRLLGGNWKIRAAAGTMFRRDWFETVEALPTDTRSVRYWDRAATEKKDAAFTAGVKIHRDQKGVFYVSDVIKFQGRPLRVEESVRNAASHDGRITIIGIEQDPGQAGVAEAESYVRLLAGFDVRVVKVSSDKVTRAKPFSAQCERGNVKILRASWNDAYLSELENFPETSLKDQVDASSGAFNLLTGGIAGEFTEKMAESKLSSTVATSLKRTRPQW